MSSSPVTDPEASGATRRASGRVRRQPDHFAASGKRKRDAQDLEAPDEDLSDEDESEDDGEPDEEELREQRSRQRKPKPAQAKKPVPKKTRTRGAALPFRNPSVVATQKPAKRKGAHGSLLAKDADGLFAQVFTSAGSLDDVAGRWIQDFKEHESRALADVINFVLRCAGCTIKVTADDVEDPDNVSNRLSDIQDEFQASEPTDYPLVAKGRTSAVFRQTMTAFVDALIKAIAATDLLYEETALIENIQTWFSTLSSATNRAFRHTSTVASLSVVTALCRIGHENAQEMAARLRQAEGERKKPRSNKKRIEDIDERAKESGRIVEFIEVQVRDWFDIIFIHRYRDVDPAIRRDSIAALGDWVMTLPEVFFDGQHLRYLGWVLSDTAAATRGEVINQLRRLYSEPSMIAGLKTFTERFRPRLVEIATLDAETAVRSAGLELLDLLRENELLEPDDVDAVGRVIYDSDPKVRRSVAGFFAENINDLYNAKIDDMGGLEGLEEALPEPSNSNFDAPRLEWLKYKCLAEMMVAYDLDDVSPVERNRGERLFTLHAAGTDSRFTMAADALCEKIDEIQDWQALAGFLLFDHSTSRADGSSSDVLTLMKKECALSDLEENVLLHVVNASVKRAVVHLGEKGTTFKTKLTKKQKDQLTEEQEEAARHLAGLIPKLLRKFGDSPKTAAAVLHMENVLNLPSLQELRQDSTSYGVILDDIRKQFMSHATDEVLVPASDAILHAKSYGGLDDVTEGKLSGLWEDVVNNLGELVDPKIITVRGASGPEDLLALSNNLLRISRLAQVSNCVISLEDEGIVQSLQSLSNEYGGAIDVLIGLILRGLPAQGSRLDAEDAALEDEIAARAAEAVLRYMQWKINYIRDTVTSPQGSDIPYAELEVLATRRDAYFGNLMAVLSARKPGDDICVALAGLALDLSASAKVLTTFKPRPGASTEYDVLAVDLDASHVTAVMAVFSAIEQQFAHLSGRKITVANDIGNNADVDADPMDEDALLDSDSDGEHGDDAQAQASQQRKETRLHNAIVAERKLCELTRSIIFAVHARVLDADATCRRLERNKSKLGPNFKEILAYLDIGKVTKAAGGKAKAKAAKGGSVHASATRGKAHPKSNAIVADDEVDDDIEEDADEGEREAQQRRGLAEADSEEDESTAANGDAVGGEDVSVLGD